LTGKDREYVLSEFKDSSKASEWEGQLLSTLSRHVIKSMGVHLDPTGHGSTLSVRQSKKIGGSNLFGSDIYTAEREQEHKGGALHY
jgi:hypothetical protein